MTSDHDSAAFVEGSDETPEAARSLLATNAGVCVKDASPSERHAHALAEYWRSLALKAKDDRSRGLILDVARTMPLQLLRESARLISLPQRSEPPIRILFGDALVSRRSAHLRACGGTIALYSTHRLPDHLSAQRDNLERYAQTLQSPEEILRPDRPLARLRHSPKYWAEWLADIHLRRCRAWADQLLIFSEQGLCRALQVDMTNAVASYLSALRESDFWAASLFVDGLHSAASIRASAEALRMPEPTGRDLMARHAVLQAVRQLPFLEEVIEDAWTQSEAVEARASPCGFSPGAQLSPQDRASAETILRGIDAGAPLFQSVARATGCEQWVVRRVCGMFPDGASHCSWPRTLQQMNRLRPEIAPQSTDDLMSMAFVLDLAEAGIESGDPALSELGRAITDSLNSRDQRALQCLIRDSSYFELKDYLEFLDWLRREERPEIGQEMSLGKWLGHPSLAELRGLSARWRQAEGRARQMLLGDFEPAKPRAQPWDGWLADTESDSESDSRCMQTNAARCTASEASPTSDTAMPVGAEWLPLLPHELSSAHLQYREIVTQAQLKQEAEEMRHCADGYLQVCQGSLLNIVSVTRAGERVATLELRVDWGDNRQPVISLTQAVGPRNSALLPEVIREILMFTESLGGRPEIIEQAKLILVRREKILSVGEPSSAELFSEIARSNAAAATRLYLPAVKCLKSRATAVLNAAASRLALAV